MPRLFTVEEANALVPRIDALFARYLKTREETRPIREQLAHVEQNGYSNGVDLATKLRELRRQLEAKDGELNAPLQEIAAMGCEIKDPDQGLVDFPSLREGRVVYLCWKLGEDRIRFWHETTAGFAGRQPL